MYSVTLTKQVKTRESIIEIFLNEYHDQDHINPIDNLLRIILKLN